MSQREAVLDRHNLDDGSDIRLEKEPTGKSRGGTECSHGELSDQASEDRLGGMTELMKDPTMAHLLDALNEGQDIGHHGRLAFCMIAPRFLGRDEMICLLSQDPQFSEENAEHLIAQAERNGPEQSDHTDVTASRARSDSRTALKIDPNHGSVRHIPKPPMTAKGTPSASRMRRCKSGRPSRLFAS